MSQQEPEQDEDEAGGRPEIVKTERTMPFAGLTRHNNVDLPDDVFGHHSAIRWWAEQKNYGVWKDEGADPVGLDESVESYNTSIRDLPRATLAEAAWVHPRTGEVIRTGKHNAVVNPTVVDELEKHVDEDDAGFQYDSKYVGSVEEAKEAWGEEGWRQHVIGDDALYNIPTDDYTVVNPMEFLDPLTEVIQDRGLDDALFGEFRLFRSGGKVSGDIFFNGQYVDVPGRDDDSKPIVVGFQVDWDHFGGTSIHAQGMAMNWECVNAFRAITDEVLIKHTGDMEERMFEVGDKKVGSWEEVWDTLFDLIDEKRDMLADMIQEAMEMDLEDVFELPDNFEEPYLDERHNKTGVNDLLYAFYRYNGYPGYLAAEAARDAAANADDPYNPDFWTMHSGATYAVSHHSRAEAFAGSQMDQQVRIANDLLFNPPQVAEQVQAAYEERIAEEDESLASEGGGEARIVRDENVSDAVERFKEREERMRALAPEMDA